jgi:deazaflavin-dependent oxidoreductase (nitroreductase family)
MTAAQQEVRTPPRVFIRTVWKLHRAAYRVTRGRFGLAEPKAGEKFGFMRIHTVGRRTGKPRVAIIGYFNDGPNLVTIAMNGWGKSDPAWWLNLQGQPEATVDLVGETRTVRARVAVGPERERLWAEVAEYPGWGADVDALAARRPKDTKVVVLEPIHRIKRLHEMTGSVNQRPRVNPAKPGRLHLRHAWVVPGLALSVYASVESSRLGVGLVVLLAFGIVPHLPALAGLVMAHAKGQMPRPAVPIFNAMHDPLLPIVLVALGLANVLPPIATVGGLAWISYIIVDWALGDGRRTRDGYKRGSTALTASPTTPQLAPVVVRAESPTGR